MPFTTITDLRHDLGQDGELAEGLPGPARRLARFQGAIVWICPECRDQGWISGWQGTPWDRRDQVFGEAS